jgi:hypothetical protein
MRAPIALCLFAIALVGGESQAIADDHFGRMNAYAHLAAMPMIDDALRRNHAEIAAAFERLGALQWCKSAWALLGPEGSFVPGILMEKATSGETDSGGLY